jgi:predicted PurR-regulated permease PerM
MLPTYSTQFAQIGANIGSWLQSLGFGAEQVQQIVETMDPQNITAVITDALGSVVSITGALVIVLTMMILMAADAVYARAVFGQLSEHEPDLVIAMTNYASNVRRYMLVTTVLGLVQGALDAAALYLLQVPAALLWGLLAFLCSYIPNVGYFFAILPPLLFGFLVGGWPTVIVIVIVYGLINAVIQSIIQPRVVGQAVSLSQTITFFSLLFWAIILGPVGAILAIPLTLLAKTFFIDADPHAHWWQPALGPTAETRDLAKAADAAAKRSRREQRTTHKAPQTNSDRKGST